MGAAMLLGLIALGGLGIWAGQRRLIYFPEASVPAAPAPWQEVSYSTSDGLTLDAWYRPPEPGQPVVVVFNGNAGNRAGRLPLGARLAGAGMGVLLTDYRGYGGNPGHPSETGLARDARAAIAFVGERAPGHRLVYYGESLGAAVAIEVAAAEPPAALVLRSPFTSLVDVARVHYPWLPLAGLLRDRYPSLERIGTVTAPTLVIAGEADSIVPPGQSREIFTAAGEPKQLFIVAGADHNDEPLAAGPELVEAVAGFVAAYG